jgi:hypothetical protein
VGRMSVVQSLYRDLADYNKKILLLLEDIQESNTELEQEDLVAHAKKKIQDSINRKKVTEFELENQREICIKLLSIALNCDCDCDSE